MFNHNHDHSPEAISERLNKGPSEFYLKEWVYGGIDGVVTTFAIVAAVIGANLSPLIVLILGLANLVGDGFSMAAGAYSSSKAEHDNYKRLHNIEESHIEKHYEGEIEETRQIFEAKGFVGDELDQMVKSISRDHKLWIQFMLQEEYGVAKPSHSALGSGFHTFLAFIICGAMPLIPFLFYTEQAPAFALCASAITFFIIGSLKSLWSIKHWSREGLETMFIGLAAAGMAFVIGYALRNFTGIAL